MNVVFTALISIILILLPWGRSITAVGIVALIVVWIASFDWDNKLKQLYINKLTVFPFLLYFLAQLFGLFFSSDLNSGWVEISRKLNFLILPIILATINDKLELNRDKIFQSLIFSLLIYFAYSLTTAYFEYIGGYKLAFVYIHLISATKMHPSYVSVFLIIAIAMAYKLGSEGRRAFYFSIPIFVIFTLLLSARTEILILGIELIVLCLYHFISIKKYTVAYLGATAIVILSILSIFFIPELNTRFSVLVKGQEHPETLMTIKNERSQIWSIAVEQIKRNPAIGIGTGMSAAFFKQQFIKRDYKILSIKGINNSHNQFIQEWLIVGFLGFLILIFICIFLFLTAFKTKNIYLFIYLITMVVASITECILETQSGIVAFVIFGMLLLLDPVSKCRS